MVVAVWLVGALWGDTASAQRSTARRRTTQGRPVAVASLLRRVDVIQSHYAQESGLEDSLATVVRDSAEWERLWKRIDDRSGRTPRVDFGREMVLIYGLGRQFDMGGIQLEVESATLRGDTLVTVIRKTITFGRCHVSNDSSDSPLAVATTGQRPGPVRFVVHSVKAACPPLRAPRGGKAKTPAIKPPPVRGTAPAR
jgi:hypothetical protein